MDKQNYSWETTFDTANDLMIHTFTDRVKVIASLKTGVAKVLRDGDIINTIENPAISDYERMLSKVAIDAHALEAFNSEL